MVNSLAVGQTPVVLALFLKLYLIVELSIKNIVPFSYFL